MPANSTTHLDKLKSYLNSILAQELETRTDRAVLQRGRRFLPAGLLIAIAAVAIAAWGGRTTPPTRVPDVLLLYVGADDCAPCRAWQKGDGAEKAFIELLGSGVDACQVVETEERVRTDLGELRQHLDGALVLALHLQSVGLAEEIDGLIALV